MITRMNRYLWLVLAAAGLWVLIGCGVDHSPTASEPDAAQTSSLNLASGPAGQGAAKVTSSKNRTRIRIMRASDRWNSPVNYGAMERNRSQTETIGRRGGSVKVELKGERTGQDDLKAVLRVPAGALDRPVAITLTLRGETLADMVVEFDPEGLVFNTPAQLWIKVGSALVDLPTDSLVALHTEGSGDTEKTEQVKVRFEKTREATWIVIEVPGFSRYSVGGGNP